MQSLPALPTVVVKSTQRGELARDLLQVAEKDYLYVLHSIAKDEIAQQEKIKNPPTGMVIDGRKGKEILLARRSIVAWFADRASLSDAIIEAYKILATTGRTVSGRTAGSARYFYSVGKGGAITQTADVRGVAATVPNPAALNLYVAIPRAHVRRWQWLSASGTRMQRVTRNKKLLRYARAHGKRSQMVSASVFENTAKAVQARFRSLDVKPIYLSYPNLNTGGTVAVDRIPAIKVCMKIRGRGR